VAALAIHYLYNAASFDLQLKSVHWPLTIIKRRN